MICVVEEPNDVLAIEKTGEYFALFSVVGKASSLMGPFVFRLRRSRPLGAFLDGVNVAALALMGSVTLQFARPALTNGPTVALFLVCVAILASIRINAAWLVLLGGILGVVFG